MHIVSVIAAIVKILIIVGFVVNIAAVLTWMERRQSAMLQDRVGPNRADINIFGVKITLAGLLHPVADAVKMIFKEDFVPPKADRLLHALGPVLSLFPPLVLLAVVPFTDTLCLDSIRNAPLTASVARFGTCVASASPKAVHPISGMVMDLNVGILYIFALAGMGIVGATVAGWSSDNKFSLLGGLRAASQLVSYEVAMGLSVVGCMMVYSSLRLDDISNWQGENVWGIFVQPFAFILFFAAAMAESKRTPFDLPEGESEIVAGYFLEYSGMKWGMFMMGEYIEIAVTSGLLVALFLGGFHLPFLHRDGITATWGGDVLFHATLPHLLVIVLQTLIFFGKTLLVCWFQIFFRWTLPRFRYDQLMKLGWRMLLPAALANIFVTGVVILAIDRSGAAFHQSLGYLADALNWLTLAGLIAGFLAVVFTFASPIRYFSRGVPRFRARAIA